MNDHIARVASEVVTGLKGSPVMLGLLVLNTIGIGAACWFLSALAKAQGARLDLILRSCLPGVRP
jgi:hypothetical protein